CALPISHFRAHSRCPLRSHHAGEIIVHGPAYDVADDNPHQRDGTVEGTENGPENGADPGNIEKLDQKCPGRTDGDIVHPVVQALLGRCSGGVYAGLFLDEGAVEPVTEQQYGKASEEDEHGMTSLLLSGTCCSQSAIVTTDVHFSRRNRGR